MSEAQKPVEETPVAAPATETPAAATEAPAPVSEVTAPVDAPATEAPKDTPAQPEVPAKEESKAEVTPATDGVLGYKAPGLVKSLRFSKRYFWFSDDAVEIKDLSTYFQHEKLSVAHSTAAWASQTGKGLLFFAKRAEDKAHPTGIINLAEITDVVKEGFHELAFKWNGHKHAFQATSGDERDSWLAAIEAKSAEGKAEKETVVASEGYKAELEKLAKPAVPVVASSSPKKSMETKAKDVVKKVEGDETKAKSRSQSRKRASIFGSILGKKEEGEAKKEEAKKEELPEGEEAKKPETDAPTEAPPATAATVSQGETPAEATEAAPAAETKTEEPKRPEAKKRSSMFGSFFQKVANQGHGKAEKDSAAKPAETTTTVSSTAPQLGDPVNPTASEPIQPETVTQPEATTEPPKEAKEEPAISPSSIKGGFLNFMKKEKHEDKKEPKPEEKSDKKPEETPATEEPAATAEQATGATLKEKRRTSFFGNFGAKKEKKAEPAEGEHAEGEQAKARSPSIPRLGGLFRKPSKAVQKDKEPATGGAEGETPAEGADKAKPAAETPTLAVNGTETPENKPAETAAPAAQPVQAAA
ncbi:hypothetical protein PRK78_001187 [Emydomyces testavorans]|uniref:PH domain-containing protein n=1 Tax=Emydomyces testavorans TaxID=2070801 RepID=A0AAF0IIF0_9EURO|nr:hypothetical protein PRK78_001187 [Emydomyces testavorans]